MRDEDNINALERCKGYLTDDCTKCSYVEKYPRCYNFLKKYIIDLINRQQAEIERLQQNIDGLNIVSKNHIKCIQSEAIKEFAARLCKGRVSNDLVVIAVQVELKDMDGGEW